MQVAGAEKSGGGQRDGARINVRGWLGRRAQRVGTGKLVNKGFFPTRQSELENNVGKNKSSQLPNFS